MQLQMDPGRGMKGNVVVFFAVADVAAFDQLPGRPIQIFAHSFPDEEIESDAKKVLKSLISIDREVTAMNGRCYTLRIAPYRTTENSIRGLVITIIDSLGPKQKGKKD